MKSLAAAARCTAPARVAARAAAAAAGPAPVAAAWAAWAAARPVPARATEAWVASRSASWACGGSSRSKGPVRPLLGAGDGKAPDPRRPPP